MYIKYITYLYIVLYVFFIHILMNKHKYWYFYVKYIFYMHHTCRFCIFFYNSNQFKTEHDGILKKFIKNKYKIEYFILTIGIK